MSDTQFSAADWRPGSRRGSYPRQRAWGGQKQAPAAFLALSGSTVGFGSGKHERCAHCGRFALKDVGLCRWHGGARATMKRRPYIARRLPPKAQRVDAPSF
jgi:hypothetical protein